jgi:hypothetical protein
MHRILILPDTGYPVRRDTGYPAGLFAQKLNVFCNMKLTKKPESVSLEFFSTLCLKRNLSVANRNDSTGFETSVFASGVRSQGLYTVT